MRCSSASSFDRNTADDLCISSASDTTRRRSALLGPPGAASSSAAGGLSASSRAGSCRSRSEGTESWVPSGAPAVLFASCSATMTESYLRTFAWCSRSAWSRISRAKLTRTSLIPASTLACFNSFSSAATISRWTSRSGGTMAGGFSKGGGGAEGSSALPRGGGAGYCAACPRVMGARL